MSYTLPNTILNGTTADAGQVEANFLALLAATNNSLAADGTIGPTAAIPWNSQNLTGVNTLGAVTLNVSGVSTLSGNTTVGGTLNIVGQVTGAGFTGGGLNITGSGAFSSGVSADSFTVNSNSGARGYTSLSSGTSSVTGYVQFLNAGGASQGYIGQVAASGAVQYANQNGGGHNFVGGAVSMSGNLTVAGSVSSGQVAVTTSGSSGSISIVDTGGSGAGIALTGNGATTPRKFIRANGGQLQVVNDGYTTVILTLSDGGTMTLTGGLTASAGLTGTGVTATTNGMSVTANQYYTMASGVGIRYNSSTGKIEFVSGGVLVASLDASGNLICKGGVTGGGTP